MKYELRDVDAMIEGDSWCYNASYKMSEFICKTDNPKRAMLKALHKAGVSCNRGKCVVIDDGDILELIERKSKEPLFCAVPLQ